MTLDSRGTMPPTPASYRATRHYLLALGLIAALIFVAIVGLYLLSTTLNAVAAQIGADSITMFVGLEFGVATVLTLALVLLCVESLFIFRPLIQRLERETGQLIASQRQLDAVLDTVGEAIVAIDRDSCIVRVNQEVQNIWGYDQHALTGEKLERLLAPKYRETHHDASDMRRLGERVEIEGMRQDGTVFPLEIRVTKTTESDAPLFTAAMRDITARKQQEGQIRHQFETINALYVSAQKLSESLDLRNLAADVTRACVAEFGARLAWLGSADPDGRVRPFAQYPPETDFLNQISVRWDDPETPEAQGQSGRAIRMGIPIVTADLTSDETYTPWRETASAHRFCCGAAFPLISHDRPFGVLNLYSDQSDFFTAERISFFQSYAHQAAAALENARLFADERRQLERLQALRAVDMAITSSLDLRVTLNVLLDQVINHLRADAAVVLVLNADTQVLEHFADRGFYYDHVARTRLRLGRGHAGQAALERRAISVAALSVDKDDAARAPLLAGEGFVAYYAMPLLARGQIKGVLEIFQRSAHSADSDWRNFLEALAAQAAIAIENTTLFNGLQRSNIELKLAYDDTLAGWSHALDLRDRETEGHTLRVTELALRLARTLGMNGDQLVQIQRGGLLHDIGKLGIPDDVLLKTGPLTDEEWEIMRRHPVYAFEMLQPIAFLRPALDIPYAHHEKWDGSGYPRGLKGEQIPLAARIFAVADAWDALISDRPYRKAWLLPEVRGHIRALAGIHFDPMVVDAFLKMMEEMEG
ncbi:MAG: HD domain-containing phosphohydrolase, partial [Chloroflexota bacterium]